MKLQLNIAMGAALGLSLAGAALAQSSTTYKLDTNAPLQYEAGGQDLSKDQCVTLLKDRVRVTQDRTRLIADRLKIIASKTKDGCGDVARLEATGNVYYVTPVQSIRSSTAVYEPNKQTAQFDGDVVAVQGKDVTTTEHLTVNTETYSAQASGGVRGVIYPNKGAPDAKGAPASKGLK